MARVASQTVVNNRQSLANQACNKPKGQKNIKNRKTHKYKRVGQKERGAFGGALPTQSATTDNTDRQLLSEIYSPMWFKVVKSQEGRRTSLHRRHERHPQAYGGNIHAPCLALPCLALPCGGGVVNESFTPPSLFNQPDGQRRMRCLLVIVAGILALRADALLGDQYLICSPCSRSDAAALCKTASSEDAAGDYWVALMPSDACPLSVDRASQTAPSSIQAALGVPRVLAGGTPVVAVGRLRRQRSPPTIDRLTCILPKEDEHHAPVMGLVIDALLLAWAEWLERDTSRKAAFETLAACAGLEMDAILVSRGFRENNKVDFATLATGHGLPTHTARLPTALFAAQARAAQAPTQGDLEHAKAIVRSLRALDAPQLNARDVPGDLSSEGNTSKRDPWAAPIKGFGQ